MVNSVFRGQNFLVPMRDVRYMQQWRIADGILKIRVYMPGFSPDDQLRLEGEQASAFLDTWLAYRKEIDSY